MTEGVTEGGRVDRDGGGDGGGDDRGGGAAPKQNARGLTVLRCYSRGNLCKSSDGGCSRRV